MGGGAYSYDNAVSSRTDKGWASEDLLRAAKRAIPKGYKMKAAAEVFEQRTLHNEMSPHGVKIREARDSAEHPESIAIIIALDETGSMGDVPDHLVKEGLPHMMDNIYKAGVKDPQVLFLGIGDHECDRAPLQVGQFESSDELLDKWLTQVWLEGKGGGNAGESYALAWFFAAKHTALDCLEKRGKKGILFTIGDEPVLNDYPAQVQEALMGKGQYSDETAASLLAKAREKYECFHIHIAETHTGSAKSTINGWRELMRDNLFVAKSHKEVPKIIAEAIVRVTGAKASDAPVMEKKETPAAPDAPKKQEEML
jgi:hypothetical protein